MSRISDLLKKIIPDGLSDTIKSPITGSLKSKMSAFLTSARSLTYNSSIKSLAFASCFSESSDLISDVVINGVFDYVPYDAETETQSNTSIYGLSLNPSVYALYSLVYDFVTGTGAKTVGSRNDSYVVDVTTSNGKVLRLEATEHHTYGPTGFIYMLDLAGNRLGSLFSQPLIDSERIYVFDNVVTFTDGTHASIWDVIRDQSENYALSNALCLLTETLNSVDPTLTDIISATTTWVNSEWATVRDLAPKVIRAFQTGGIYGVVMVIHSYFNAVSNLTADEQGLKFTDNSLLIPSVYIAGVTNIIVSTLAGVANAIAMAFSRVLGVLFSAISTVATSIVQAINYDYRTATTAALTDSWSAGYPLAPHGLFGTTANLSAQASQLFDFAVEGGFFGFFVPGGVVITLIDASGKVQCEFHPDLVDRRAVISSLTTGTPGPAPSEVTYTLLNKDSLMTIINNVPQSSVTFENNEDGVLSETDSKTLMDILFVNCMLFCLYQFDLPDETHTITIKNDGNFGDISYKVDNGEWVSINLVGNNPLACIILLMWYATTDYGAFFTDAPKDWGGLAYIAKHLNAHTESSSDYVQVSSTIYLDLNVQIHNFVLNQYNVNPADYYFGEPFQLTNNMSWGIQTPKYERSSFISSLILVGVVALTMVAIVAVSSFAIARAVSAKRAQLKVQAEKDWDNMSEDPSSANYTKYRKSARKYNLFAKLFGGDVISMSDYWGSSGQGEVSVNNIISSVGSNLNGTTDLSTGSSTSLPLSVEEIKRLIIG